MNRRLPITVLAFAFTCLTVLLSGCISTPFHVAGDIIGATGDVVGAVASVPFEIAEATVDVPFDIAEGVVEAPVSMKAKYTERLDWRFDGESIDRIDLENRNGTVEICGTDSEWITVNAEKKVRAKSSPEAERYAEDVEVLIDDFGGKLQIRNTPTHHTKRYNYSIDYRIEVPRFMNLVITAHNGGVEIERVEGELRVESHNGSIRAEDCAGEASLITHNGWLHADLNRLVGKGTFESHNGGVKVKILDVQANAELHSGNGTVELTVPSYFEGRLDATSGNGSVQSELPVYVRSPRNNQLVGDIGSGNGPRLTLHSGNGSVRLKALEDGYNTMGR